MAESKTVADIIGDWGRWQTNVFLFCLFNYVLQAYNSLSFYYFAPKLAFWCEDEPVSRHSNLTDAAKCEHFVNCSQWVIEDTFGSTIVNEWQLVCKKDWLVSFTQTAYMFGYIPSGLLLALAADRIGRVPTIWFSFFLELLAGIAIIFSSSIWQFIIARFVMGVGVCTRGNVLFALCKFPL